MYRNVISLNETALYLIIAQEYAPHNPGRVFGSITSFNAICTTRSWIDGMPSGRLDRLSSGYSGAVRAVDGSASGRDIPGIPRLCIFRISKKMALALIR